MLKYLILRYVQVIFFISSEYSWTLKRCFEWNVPAAVSIPVPYTNQIFVKGVVGEANEPFCLGSDLSKIRIRLTSWPVQPLHISRMRCLFAVSRGIVVYVVSLDSGNSIQRSRVNKGQLDVWPQFTFKSIMPNCFRRRLWGLFLRLFYLFTMAIKKEMFCNASLLMRH